MAVTTCPKGHSSTENDYCSECGAKINGAGKMAGTLPADPPVAQRTGGLTCPDCGVPHGPSTGDYCEVCGYNFKTGAHGELQMPPVAVAAAAPAAPAPAPPPPQSAPAPVAAPVAAPVVVEEVGTTTVPSPAPLSKLLGWEVTITADSKLKTEGSPECPADFEPIVAALRAGSNLIGRTSPRRGIEPEVAIDHDDAISHRHALLEVHGDGGLTLRDIGSSNGTSVNGKEIKQLEDVKIDDGDQITLGHWSRLLVKAVR